ncbi:hypothetical protein PHMEG_00033874 [Phytophthora megakarya]|uniref:Uncharacterized protein n=1 Tax=Phytophthora megakarya TaxID=4795 RepID=A0A225USI0_9STRA|nr:hypothetical protein PHMEG_00033874 [Phytophthora megakarya]
MDENRTLLFNYRATSALEMAAEHGHLEIVQWIYNVHTDVVNWCDVIDSAIDKAVSNGHLAIVQWLYNTGTRRYYPQTVHEAAQNGHLTMLQWLHSNDLLTYSSNSIWRAAKNGHLDVLKWLIEIGGEIRLGQDSCLTAGEVLCWAASNGHLKVVEWIYGNVTKDIPMDDVWWVNKAAQGGHLNVLKWIYIHFPGTFSKDTMDDAAEGGHLDVVVWLHEYPNKGFTLKSPYWASHNGHVRVLQRLYAYNPEVFDPSLRAILMDMDSLGDAAARKGHLEIVQWLNENDCGGFTKDAMSSAAENGHLNVVLYLLEHRSEGFRSDAMIRPGDIEVVCTQTKCCSRLSRLDLPLFEDV